MRWLTKLLFAVVVLSGVALGQAFTQVTGQAKDAQGNLYTNCVFSIHFVGQSSQPGPYLFQGSVFQQTYAGVRCDGFGNFAIRLPSNQAIFPQPSGWEFNICNASGHFCNGAGTGIITIAGSSQDITAIMSPLLPILPPVTGEVKSIFGRTGQVVAVTGDYNVSQVTGAASLNSPVFSGVVQVPTAPVGTFSPQAASTAFVMTAIGNAISGGGGGGGGGWNPPAAPGDTLFGNNTVASGTPSFFIPGGDVSFSSGNFSVNQLHFGPNALSLTNTGIASGNCLQVSGSQVIGGACGTGGSGGLSGSGSANLLAKFTAATTLGSSLLSDNGTALSYTGTGGISAPQFSSTGTGGLLLTSPVSPLPSSTAGAGYNGLATGPDGWYLSEANGAWTRIGTGTTGTAGVSSFGTPPRTGPVVPVAGDYTVAQVTGAAPLVSPDFSSAGSVPLAPTAAQTVSNNQIATTAFVHAAVNAGPGGGGGTPVTEITQSPGQAPVCLTQPDQALQLLTFPSLTIVDGDTVLVLVAHYGLASGNVDITEVVSDGGINTFASKRHNQPVNYRGSMSIYGTPAGGSKATTSLNIATSAAGRFLACVVSYHGVFDYGVAAGVNSGPASATGTISLTTTDPNNVMVALLAQSSASNPTGSFTVGTELQRLSISSAMGGLLCQNGSPTAQTSIACTFQANSGSYSWFGIAIELRCCAGTTAGPGPLPGMPKVVAYHGAVITVTTTAANDVAFFTCPATDCPQGFYRVAYDIMVLTGCTGGSFINNVEYFDDYDLTNTYRTGILTTAAGMTGRNHVFGSRLFVTSKPINSTDGIRFSTSSGGTASSPCSTGTGTVKLVMTVERLQ